MHLLPMVLALRRSSTLKWAFRAYHRNLSMAAVAGTRDDRFATLTDDDVAHFRKVLGDASVITDASELEPYNADWMGRYKGRSMIALKPRSTEDVAAIMTHCNQRRLAVVPQGGNTGLVGGSVPVHDEVILSLSAMKQVESFDTADGVAVVQAGVILETLDAHVRPHGYRAPLDLGAKGSCHVGGNVATNAGGSRMVRDGPLRAAVLGLEAVLPDGRILDALTTLRKDNTGYDVKQLFIGSEGTLGIITRIALTCAPRSSTCHTVALAIEDFRQVAGLLQASKAHLGTALHAYEYMDSASVRLAKKTLSHVENVPLDPDAANCFLLIDAADSNSLEQFVEHAFESSAAVDGVIAENDTQAAALWELRESMSEAVVRAGKAGTLKYDVSLPINMFEDAVSQARERVGEGAEVVGWGHIGDGNLHLNVAIEDGGNLEAAKSALEPWIYEYVSSHRGSVSAEHGIGQMKAHALRYSKSDVAVDLMRSIKQSLDPNGICNPYKVLT